MVHNGKIYIYYKGAFNRPNTVWVALRLATCDNPLGPFKKCPQNPVVNSGHELCFFRYSNDCSYLARFDCDLSLDVNDPEMKKHQNPIDAETYFKKGLRAKQLKRILKK